MRCSFFSRDLGHDCHLSLFSLSLVLDLSRLHADRLRVSFESESEEKARDQEIEVVTQQITTVSRFPFSLSLSFRRVCMLFAVSLFVPVCNAGWQAFHQCEQKLKRIASVGNTYIALSSSSSSSDSSSSAASLGFSSLSFQERQVRYNVMRAEAVRIQELSKAFRKQQKDFLKRMMNLHACHFVTHAA